MGLMGVIGTPTGSTRGMWDLWEVYLCGNGYMSLG